MFFQHHWTYGGKITWFVCLYQVGEKPYAFNAWAGALLTCDLNVGVHSWLKHHGRPSREQPLCNANFYLFDFDLVTTWFKQFPWVSQIWTRKNHPTLHKIRKFDACLYTHVSENDACNYTTGNSDTQKKNVGRPGCQKNISRVESVRRCEFFLRSNAFLIAHLDYLHVFQSIQMTCSLCCSSVQVTGVQRQLWTVHGWSSMGSRRCWWDCCVAWWKICSKGFGNPSTTHGCSGFLDSCINSQEDATCWTFCVFAYKKTIIVGCICFPIFSELWVIRSR